MKGEMDEGRAGGRARERGREGVGREGGRGGREGGEGGREPQRSRVTI